MTSIVTRPSAVEQRLWQGLTYDDVLLVPKRSPVKSRKEVTTKTKLSRNITLNIPVVASNMDTVTEERMAVAVAREGGIGILHRFASIKEQVAMVSRVKRAQSFLIKDPRSIAPTATKEDAQEGLNCEGRKGGVRSLMVVTPDGKLLGVLTSVDLQFAPPGTKVKDMMTPIDRVTLSRNVNITFEEAKELIHQKRTSNIPIVDDQDYLKYLITSGDIRKLTDHTNASLDSKGSLLVGAAVGVKKDDVTRAEELVAAGADVLVIDIAHGHSDFCIDMLKQLKSNPKTNTVDIIAGNIATGEGAKDLIAAGADGLKIGVGPGSICITRLVAGSGVPQLSALLDVARVARPAGVPIIADGGTRTAGDLAKACAAGADTVMLGNLLSGTDESPGTVLVKDGKKVKIIRGMAGYGANLSKAQREKQVDEDVFQSMVPEGVEGSVPYKGPVVPIIRQLVGGLRSGVSYCGARNLAEMRKNAEFVRMSPAGLKESGSHLQDVERERTYLGSSWLCIDPDCGPRVRHSSGLAIDIDSSTTIFPFPLTT